MLINCSDYSQYQSNGLCYNFCLSDYAFAVLKGADCYCSDYIPGSTTSNDDCNIPCPGYPDDLCGNDGSGLYAYISLPNHQASGTEGGSSSTPSSTPQSPVSTPILHFRPFLFNIFLLLPYFINSGRHNVCPYWQSI